MKILKKENWWIWLLLAIFSNGSNVIVLGALLDVYKKDSWYSKWYYWVLGIPFVIPFIAMVCIFYLEIICKTAYKLEVSGKEIYLSPYTWIICLIIPIIRWIFGLIMFIYLQVDILYRLYLGNGEKYINQ